MKYTPSTATQLVPASHQLILARIACVREREKKLTTSYLKRAMIGTVTHLLRSSPSLSLSCAVEAVYNAYWKHI